jgi:hypothetical protein
MKIKTKVSLYEKVFKNFLPHYLQKKQNESTGLKIKKNISLGVSSFSIYLQAQWQVIIIMDRSATLCTLQIAVDF